MQSRRKKETEEEKENTAVTEARKNVRQSKNKVDIIVINVTTKRERNASVQNKRKWRRN